MQKGERMKRKHEYFSEPCCICKKPTNGIYYRFKPELCNRQDNKHEWTHAICDACFDEKEPYRKATRMLKEAKGEMNVRL